MHRLRIFYRNNKQKIWTIVLIVVLVFVLLRMLNNRAKTDNESNNVNTENTSNNSYDVYLPSKSVITNDSISEDTSKENYDIIKNFIDVCNNGSVEEAYNMLSMQCKEEVYPTQDMFYDEYFSKIFDSKKSYDITAWMESNNITYKINFMSDLLATGKQDEETFEDYYTVVYENGEDKLNIRGFVEKEDINNKSAEESDVIFTVKSKVVYMDDESYEIEITNNNDEVVKLDSKESTDSVYLKDENGVRYNWMGHEIDDKQLVLEAGETKTLNIKFNKLYNPRRIDTQISFTNIVIGENNETWIDINL